MLDLFFSVLEKVKLAQVDLSMANTTRVPRVKRKWRRKEPEKTPQEIAAESMVGAPSPTPGQYGRWGAIGAGAGLTSLGLTGAIEGGKWVFPRIGKEKIWGGAGDVFERTVRGGGTARKPILLHPRAVARALATGVLFSTAVPAARRVWDVRTAQKSPEKF